jgi:four helix bundle protein
MAKIRSVATHYDLRDQLISSAASICANIAEGFGRRSHPDFARFLAISSGSVKELQNHLTDIVDRRLLDESELAKAQELARRTAAALASFIGYLKRTPTPKFDRGRDPR